MAEAPPSRRTVAGARDRADRLTRKYSDRLSGTAAEHLARRLGAVDIVNRGMLFAATLLLCFFPFLIVLNALAGRQTVTGLARHLALDQKAAGYVGGLFAPSHETSSAVNGAGYAFFIFGGVAAAAALQELYERAFELEGRGMRDLPRRVAWLGGLIAACLLANWVGPRLRATGGPVLLAAVGLPAIIGFWWLTMWCLLGGRVHWRGLLPCAVATGVFWLGMQIVFAFTFSGMVISNHREYGPIGVVFALMSWLIAIGVVIMLGAVVGVVWRERQLSLTGAVRRLTRGRRASSP